MATLSSSSTLEQIQAEYANTASYAEDGDVGKARRFVTACRILLLKRPRRHGGRDDETEWDTETIRKELEAAQAWLERVGGETPVPSSASATGEEARPRLTYADMQSFRDP